MEQWDQLVRGSGAAERVAFLQSNRPAIIDLFDGIAAGYLACEPIESKACAKARLMLDVLGTDMQGTFAVKFYEKEARRIEALSGTARRKAARAASTVEDAKERLRTMSADELVRLADRVLPTYQEIGDSRGQGLARLALALASTQRSDLSRAFDQGRKALALLEKSGSEDELPGVHDLLGRILVSVGKTSKATQYLEHAIEGYRRTRALEPFAGTSLALVSVYEQEGRSQAALSLLEEVQALENAFPDPAIRGRGLQQIGDAYSELKHYEAAIVAYRKAFAACEESMSTDALLPLLCRLIGTAHFLGDISQEDEYLNQAKDLLSQDGDQSSKSCIFGQLLARHADITNPNTLEYLAGYLENNDSSDVSLDLTPYYRAVVGYYAASKRFERALVLLEKAVHYSVSRGSLKEELEFRQAAAYTSFALGKTQAAFQQYEAAYARATELADYPAASAALKNLCGAMFYEQDPAALERYCRLYFDSVLSPPPGDVTADPFLTYSFALEMQGQFESAARILERGREAARARLNKRMVAELCNALGRVYAAKGDERLAADVFAEGADAAREASSWSLYSVIALRQGQGALAAEDLDAAHKFFSGALEGATQTRIPRDMIDTTFMIGGAYQRHGFLEQAAQYYLQVRDLSKAAGERCPEARSLAALAAVTVDDSSNDKRLRYVTEISALDISQCDARTNGEVALAACLVERARGEHEERVLHKCGRAFELLKPYLAHDYGEPLRAANEAVQELVVSGDTGQAEKLVDEVLVAVEHLRNPQDLIDVEVWAFSTFEAIGRDTRAEQVINKAQEHATDLGDPGRIESVMVGRLDMLGKRGRNREAEAAAKQLLAHCASSNRAPACAQPGLMALCSSYHMRNIDDEALPWCSKAVEATSQATVERAVSLNLLALVEYTLQKYPAAKSHAEESLAILMALDNRDLLSNALGTQGLILEGIGQWNEALAAHQRAYELSEAIAAGKGIPHAESMVRCLIALGKYERAKSILTKAIQASTSPADRNNLGLDMIGLLRARGQYSEGITLARELLDQAPSSAVSIRIRLYDHLVNLYQSIGDVKALSEVNDLLYDDLETIHEDWYRWTLACELVVSYARSGNLSRAQQTAKRFVEPGGVATIMRSHANVACGGAVALGMIADGHATEAARILTDVVEDLESKHNRVGELVYSLLGRAQLLSGDHESARETLERCVTNSRASGNADTESSCYADLGRLHAQRGHSPEDTNAFLHAGEALLRLINSTEGVSWQASVVSTRLDLLVDIITHLSRVADSSNDDELRSKAFFYEDIGLSFLLLTGGNGDILLGALNPKWRERYIDFSSSVQKAARAIQVERGISPERQNRLKIRNLETYLARGREEVARLIDRVSRQYPSAVGTLSVPPQDLEKVRRHLSGEVAIVEMLLTPEGPISIVARREVVAYGEGKCRAIDCERLVADLLDVIKQRPEGGEVVEWHSVAAQAYDAFLRPIIGELEGVKQILLVPEKRLRYVPWSAVWTGKEYLIERYDLAYLTSGSLLDLARDPSRSTDKNVKALILADPDGTLPNALAEAESVASILGGSKLYSGAMATKARLVAEAKGFAVLHLATHAYLNNTDTAGSYVLLAGRSMDDARLLSGEIAGLELENTELVVLSGCQTAATGEQDGREGYGLARQFERAGVQSVVASLWEVNDEATGILMKSFYRSLLGGASKAKALGDAQRETLRRLGYNHPFYWAPFVLVGDYR